VVHPSLHLEIAAEHPLQERDKESEITKQIQMTKVTESVHVHEWDVS
jgi:hypothetical protein